MFNPITFLTSLLKSSKDYFDLREPEPEPDESVKELFEKVCSDLEKYPAETWEIERRGLYLYHYKHPEILHYYIVRELGEEGLYPYIHERFSGLDFYLSRFGEPLENILVWKFDATEKEREQQKKQNALKRIINS